MSVQLLSMALAPLLGLFIMSISSALMSSLTTLRLDAMGFSATMVGVVSSAYFIGLTLGSIFNERLISRIGHIRAYSCFAALIAVTISLQGLCSDPWIWSALRLINGWAIVGVYLVVESWLLLVAEPKIRGRLLALYMIALYGAGVLGQATLGEITGWGDTAPFMVAGMLASLAGLGLSTSFGLLLLAGFTAGYCAIGGQLVLYALAPTLYPTQVRATGVGASVAVGRLGSMAGPLAAGQILAAGAGVAAALLDQELGQG